MSIAFSRVWSMPNSNTFSVPVIGKFVKKWLATSARSVDPFARDKDWATYTNDLNPHTAAMYHMDATEFLLYLAGQPGMLGSVDLAIVDPPYSPRQVSECYAAAGLKCGQADTQNAAMYARVRNALVPLLTDNAVVLSFGWSSNGMGKKHGFEIEELMLVAHGGAHNDTTCMAERRVPQ